ncbi:hypothetical protein [Pseudogemmobacter bohemicus]|uniref:hypothetical protein n=1 Tax=Pseudogemmobacter bohemicus TaxID=2250708 RepID=UPI0013002E98|nr:hypothetical protein [Pseudogemmobacter bohemicus]
MRPFVPAVFVTFGFVFTPLVAASQGRMSTEELVAYATELGSCGADKAVTEASYESETSNRIIVRCGEATGFAPLAAGAVGLGGGAAAAAAAAVGLAVAAGGGGSTPDTQ